MFKLSSDFLANFRGIQSVLQGLSDKIGDILFRLRNVEDTVQSIPLNPGSSSGGVIVKESNSTVATAATTLDFGGGFDVSETPSGEANIFLDAAEVWDTLANGTTPSTGDVPTYQSDGTVAWQTPSGGGGSATITIGATFDGLGAALVVGTTVYVRVPVACTITEATALADQSGSVVVDVWVDSYANYQPTNADSITASAPITITTATKSTDTTLTGWDTAVAAGDVVAFHIDSCSAITRLQVQLKATT